MRQNSGQNREWQALDLTTHPFAVNTVDGDKFHEECGIFGVIGSPDAAAHTVLGLHALQHRGQEAAGIVSYDQGQFYSHRSLGHVGDNFNSEAVISSLPGEAALGHNRYATTGETILRNVQPLFAEIQSGGLAIGHNGNLTNAGSLRSQLVQRGCIFQSTMDSEVIIHLIATSSYHDLLDKIIVTQLKIIKSPAGEVMHVLKKAELKNWNFGEAYFTKIKFGKVKAWRCHLRMTLNLVVPKGKVKFVFYSQKENIFKVVEIGQKNYCRVTVPPKIWFGFKGCHKNESIILNISNAQFNSKEILRRKINEIKYNW